MGSNTRPIHFLLGHEDEEDCWIIIPLLTWLVNGRSFKILRYLLTDSSDRKTDMCFSHCLVFLFLVGGCGGAAVVLSPTEKKLICIIASLKFIHSVATYSSFGVGRFKQALFPQLGRAGFESMRLMCGKVWASNLNTGGRALKYIISAKWVAVWRRRVIWRASSQCSQSPKTPGRSQMISAVMYPDVTCSSIHPITLHQSSERESRL